MTLVNEFVIEIHSFWKLFKLLLSSNKTKKKSEKKKKKSNKRNKISKTSYLFPCTFSPLAISNRYLPPLRINVPARSSLPRSHPSTHFYRVASGRQSGYVAGGAGRWWWWLKGKHDDRQRSRCGRIAKDWTSRRMVREVMVARTRVISLMRTVTPRFSTSRPISTTIDPFHQGGVRRFLRQEFHRERSCAGKHISWTFVWTSRSPSLPPSPPLPLSFEEGFCFADVRLNISSCNCAFITDTRIIANDKFSIQKFRGNLWHGRKTRERSRKVSRDNEFEGFRSWHRNEDLHISRLENEEIEIIYQ